MTRERFSRLSAIAAAVLLLCAGRGAGAGAAAGPAECSKAATAAPFSARLLSGGTVDLDSLLAGKDFLVLTFWGVNCRPCLAEIARLNALWASPEFRKRVAIVGVNTDMLGPGKLSDEMKRRGIEPAFPVIVDERYEVTNAYVDGIIPLTVLIDRDRQVRMSIVGAGDEDMDAMENVILAGKEARP